MSQQDPEQLQGTPPAAPAPAVEAPVAQPSVERAYDPEYVLGLQRMVAQQQAEINRYEPFKEDLEWMTADEARLQGVRRYRNAYEEALKPQIDPVIEGIYKHIDERTKPANEWVASQQKAAEQRAQTERQSYETENMRYLQRISAEHKLTYEQQAKLAGYADAAAQRLGRNVPIEEAWKDFSGGWGQTKTEEAKAPIQRGDSAEIGVPGPSETDSKRWVTDFHGALTDALKAEKRSA